MFHRLPSLASRLWSLVQSSLHSLEHSLVLPARDPADPRFITAQDLFAFEVAPVGQGRDLLAARLLCLHGHVGQLRAVVTEVGDLVRNDEVVLDIDRRLHVVADHPSAASAFGRGRVDTRLIDGGANGIHCRVAA
jgi:hypothetical protein